MQGKKALITGGSSGIGLAIAERFVKDGAEVAIMARRPEVVFEAAEKIGASAIAGDVVKQADCDRAVAETVERFGGLDVLVNSAGVIGGNGTADTGIEEWSRIMAINLDGTVNMCRAAIEPLKRHGGSIVNLSSVTGSRPFAQVTAYCVAKAGVDMYTKCLSLELAGDNVRVNAIAPGVVVTNLHTATGAVADYDAFLERCKETHPLGFVGEPQDIAELARYLAGDESRWVTGGIFPIDGGRANLSAR